MFTNLENYLIKCQKKLADSRNVRRLNKMFAYNMFMNSENVLDFTKCS